jgi:integrase
MPTLTKSYIERLLPEKADFVIYDDKLSGFGVKVTPKGRKVYLLHYRTHDGRQRKPSIGVHGHITCEQAREIAVEWLGERAKGKDPSISRQVQRQSPTVAELCDRYMKEHARVYKKPRSIELDGFYIEKKIKPRIGTLKAVSISKNDIVKLHASLKSTPAQANRIIMVLSKIFNLAEDWGIRPPQSNPVHNIQKYKEEKKERFLSADEIQKLGDTLNSLECEKEESIYFLNLIRLLMFTGARLGEIQFAKWEWVDLKNGVLNLPDSKTGKKIIHLSPAAVEILEHTPKVKKNPYVIVGEIEGNALYNAQKPWRRVRKLAGLNNVRMHDLRHTFASICVGQGMPLQMVAKLLGHSQTSTSERYAHLANTSVQDAAATVGNVITGNFKKSANQ